MNHPIVRVQTTSRIGYNHSPLRLICFLFSQGHCPRPEPPTTGYTCTRTRTRIGVD